MDPGSSSPRTPGERAPAGAGRVLGSPTRSARVQQRDAAGGTKVPPRDRADTWLRVHGAHTRSQFTTAPSSSLKLHESAASCGRIPRKNHSPAVHAAATGNVTM